MKRVIESYYVHPKWREILSPFSNENPLSLNNSFEIFKANNECVGNAKRYIWETLLKSHRRKTQLTSSFGDVTFFVFPFTWKKKKKLTFFFCRGIPWKSIVLCLFIKKKYKSKSFVFLYVFICPPIRFLHISKNIKISKPSCILLYLKEFFFFISGSWIVRNLVTCLIFSIVLQINMSCGYRLSCEFVGASAKKKKNQKNKIRSKGKKSLFLP